MNKPSPTPLRLAAVAAICLPLAALAATQSIAVADTEPGLASTSPYYAAPNGHGTHYVNLPANPKPVLVVFLGGTGSIPSDYTNIVDEAAVSHSGYHTGYAALSLAYLDGSTVDAVGIECGSVDACYTQARGESAYGKGVTYPGASAAYDAGAWQGKAFAPTSRGDSIVNRLVLLINCLTWRSATPDAYWQQFLLDDRHQGATYVSPHDAHGALTYARAVVPDWSRIIVAGHSQGGGDAAFLAMTLPGGVRRAALFSAPQDDPKHTAIPDVASWVAGVSHTPLARFYGLRNASGGTTAPDNEAEGAFGDNAWKNWSRLGDASAAGGLGGTGADTPTSVGDGSIVPANGSHDLYLTQPAYASPLSNHNSSAANLYARPAEQAVWDWMFSAGGTD